MPMRLARRLISCIHLLFLCQLCVGAGDEYQYVASFSEPCTGEDPTKLGPNEMLYAEEEPHHVCSPNGVYRFGMDPAGDLSLWRGPDKIWSAGTCCTGTESFVAMQKSDGNLVVYAYEDDEDGNDSQVPLWSSGATGANAILTVDDDGQARIQAGDVTAWETDAAPSAPTASSPTDPAPTAIVSDVADEYHHVADFSDPCNGDYTTELGPNTRLYADEEPHHICSPNGLYRFGMDPAGDLSLWRGPNKIWSAGTCCTGTGAFVAMQKSDGNLVVYISESGSLKPLWSSGATSADAVLTVDDDGQARTRAGTVVAWETDALVVPTVSPRPTATPTGSRKPTTAAPSPAPTASPTASPTTTSMPTGSPVNLLVILTDQQRFDAIRRVQEELGYPEEAMIRTPNIDRLSYEGAYFRNAYSHCAVCGPARTALLTGHTIENNGVRTNIVSRDETAFLPGNDAGIKLSKMRTYDEILVEDHNYIAEYYGKWHSPEFKGRCYSNDVRGTRRQAWFGKYEANNVTWHMSTGLGEFYRQWLDENGFPQEPTEEGKQRNTYSRRQYIPDPLDTRYGMPPSDAMKVSQSDQHGMNTLPDGYSITAQRGMEMLEVLDRLHETGERFSLHVSFHSPHPPIIATPKYHSMYKPEDMAVPASISDDLANSAYYWRHEKYKKQGYANASMVQRLTATYFGLITEIDEWIGSIMDKLDDLGLAENTLVAFSSDHGEMLGSHGMKSKNVFYEESAHVPLIMRLPGAIKAGTIVDNPVSHIDLHSTFLDYLGVRGRYKSDGSSLRKYIEGTDDNDDLVVTAWNYTDMSRDNQPTIDPAFMVRKGTWKLMLVGRQKVPVVDMLYDLCNDPNEMNNLVGLNGESAADEVIGKVEALKAMLVKYLAEMKHPAVEEVKSRKKWRSAAFWVGDTAVKFRNPLPGGSRTEYLYIGAGSKKDVEVASIELEGELADSFSVDWDPLENVIPGNSHRVISITYRHPGQDAEPQDSGLGSTPKKPTVADFTPADSTPADPAPTDPAPSDPAPSDPTPAPLLDPTPATVSESANCAAEDERAQECGAENLNRPEMCCEGLVCNNRASFKCVLPPTNSTTQRRSVAEAQDSESHSANLVIRTTAGEEKVVVLLPPGEASGLTQCEPMTIAIPPKADTSTDDSSAPGTPPGTPPGSRPEADPPSGQASGGALLGHKKVLYVLSLGLFIICTLA